ncbi:MAG: aminotransferase class V-fold PLP-dependent enzyme [Nitrospiraceae bacterium]|nr:aminotransferase class V-fold PLP-dependent enzyme [Nitrospiraceae bacterium]
MIYLDNAASSFPKPKQVEEAALNFLRNIGANPGRSGHRLSIEAGRIIYKTRESLAALFGVKDPLRIVFGLNATEALNLALNGILKKGDHVITSSIEHNSVMRPLRELEKNGIEISVVKCSSHGLIDPDDIRESIKKNTRLIVINHASNIIGTIQPVSEIGKIAREHGTLFLLDAAQTGGCCPIDFEKDMIDLLAFTGHKNLYGLQGTGGLIIGEIIDIKKFQPLKTGGTGSRSEYEKQPDFLPDKFESGTPNTIGLAGLGAGVEFVLKEGIKKIQKHEIKLTRKLITGLKNIQDVIVYGLDNPEKRTATVSFNIKGIASSDIGLTLDEKYDIMCRIGLHCSPAAHKTIGTFPDGTVRFSMSYFTTEKDIDNTLEAVADIAKKGK